MIFKVPSSPYHSMILWKILPLGRRIRQLSLPGEYMLNSHPHSDSLCYPAFPEVSPQKSVEGPNTSTVGSQRETDQSIPLRRVSPSARRLRSRDSQEHGGSWEKSLAHQGLLSLRCDEAQPQGMSQSRWRTELTPQPRWAGVTATPGTSPSSAERCKNHTSPGKSCHPQRAISPLPSHPTHTPALCFVFYFFFHFSHNIFKNSIDHVTLVHNNANQFKTFTLCRSLVPVYL